MKNILISAVVMLMTIGLMAQDNWDKLVTWEATYDQEQSAIIQILKDLFH